LVDAQQGVDLRQSYLSIGSVFSQSDEAVKF